MMIRDRWNAKIALILPVSLVAVNVVPFAAYAQFDLSTDSNRESSVRVAQTLFDSAQVSVPSGTVIPVTYTETGDNGEPVEKIILTPDETVDLTVTVDQPILSNFGTVLIPAGSEITGELSPIEGSTIGTQFFAETLRLPTGQTTDIDASSAPITRTEIITEETNRDFIKGAVIGAAAAAVLAEILGSIDFLEVLGGAGLGALGIFIFGGGEEEVEVVVVDPDTDLDLTLRSELQI